MSITVAWDNPEQTILRYAFDEQWTWEDFDAAFKRAIQLNDTVSHKVVVIIDTPTRLNVPANMLINSRNALRNKHKNTIFVIFVITNPFLRTMVFNLRHLSPLKNSTIALVNSLEEARTLAVERLNQLVSGL